MGEVFEANGAAEIARCWEAMRELRPRAGTAEAFAAQVAQQQAEGYRLVYLEDGGRAVACAGFRVFWMLARGRNLYVDDLATLPDERSKGWGGRLFEWLEAEARRQGCAELHLDSGVQRGAAHRFYFRRRMTISAYHFALKLG
jgi:GNAT superfamily N-acetyltransferase